MPRRGSHIAPPAVPGLWSLCKDALGTLSARCMPMMGIGLIGFAGVPALIAFATLMLSFAGFLGNSAASGQFDRLPDRLVVVFAVLMVMAGALARGAITWLALHPDSTVKAAWRAAGHRAPALLLVSCGYALCMALGAAGLALWLRAWRIDSDLMVYPPATANLQRAALAQTFDALIPDPFAPHTNAFPRLRSITFNATVNPDLLRRLRSTALKDTVVIGVPMSYAPASLEFALIPVLGLIVIAVSETLWRSRVVMVMRAEPGHVMRPLISTLRFGAMHFGAVLVRVWALRLILAAVCIAGIVLPCMVVSSQVVPALARMLDAPAIYPISLFVVSASTTLACALLATFSTLFDVKLVKALDAINIAQTHPSTLAQSPSHPPAMLQHHSLQSPAPAASS